MSPSPYFGISPVAGMGTRFEYATNLLEASRGSKAFPLCGLDEQGYPCNGNQQEGVGSTGSARTPGSMGESINENSLEAVRRKMQKQEDIFRKQVRELHRLYGVQKNLMGELKKEMEQSRLLSSMKNRHAGFVDWPHLAPARQTTHLQRLKEDGGSKERSASSSGEAIRITRGLDLEIRPSGRGDNIVIDGELSCPGFVPPVKGDTPHVNNGLDDESDVELTLSIGGRSSKRKSNSYLHHPREPEVEFSKKKHSSASTSDLGDACNSNTSNIGGSSTTSDQEKKRPHWLFSA